MRLLQAGLVGLIAVVTALGVTDGSGAYWNSAQLISGTTVTSGTPPSSTYCTVWNTLTNAAIPGASCTVGLGTAGCSNYWTVAGNVYLSITGTGITPGPSNNYGNGIRYLFKTNLKTIGCNPPGVNWTAPTTAGLSSGGSVTFSPSPWPCTNLPVIEGYVGYYTASNNMFLGTLYWNRAGNSVSCT